MSGRRAVASPPDGGVVAATGVLAALGLLMVYSTTAPLSLGAAVPPHFVRQAAGVTLGAGLAALALRVPLAAWRRLALPLWGAGVLLLVATLVVGERVNGARRWLQGPGFSFQPAEFAKWATLLAIAAVVAGREGRARRRVRRLAPVVGLAALPAALLWLQPDTGNAVLLLVLVGLVLFVAGTSLRVLAAPLGLGALAIGGTLIFRPYAADRLRGFLDPWATANAEGFQIVQSFVAFGRGGALGVGLGDGRQKLFYLPEAHTDFVLSVVAEELGVVGVTLVLGAFAALLLAGCRIARRARNRFALLVAFAMTLLVTAPALLNAAVAMGLVPPKGLPLPFLSYGRSSLLICFLAVGMLLAVGRREAAPARRALAPAEPRRSWRR